MEKEILTPVELRNCLYKKTEKLLDNRLIIMIFLLAVFLIFLFTSLLISIHIFLIILWVNFIVYAEKVLNNNIDDEAFSIYGRAYKNYFQILDLIKKYNTLKESDISSSEEWDKLIKDAHEIKNKCEIFLKSYNKCIQ